MAQKPKPLPKDSIPKKDTLILAKGHAAADTTKKPIKPTKPVTIKPYKEVITDSAITQKGLFWVHKVDDKWYFEIPNKMFGKPILIVNRFAQVSANNSQTYGGEIISQKTINFEKGPDKNIFIRGLIDITSADSTNQILKAVANSNVNPLLQAFGIQAYGKDSNSVVIDVTDFIKGDNDLVSLSGYKKTGLGASALLSDRSYIKSIKAFPVNVEIRTVKTYSGGGGSSLMGGSMMRPRDNTPMTMELNSSFLLLPEKPMSKRMFDKRVGYFADNYTQYGDDQQKVEDKTFVVRWRLEPKEEDRKKWESGQLVEPKKQIIYYIDPATPKKWRPYLIAGINDWQKAFEKAGFKNAIVGKEWPENDTTMSMEDARFSVVRYFASDIENAYGPNVHDPRSGEILESHIGWYHNVMKLLHDWYMIQAGPIDPKARKMKYDDELMGNLIRFVSSHEIGHTLGLRHNMGSSSKTPVELLRNKKWVEANGHTASIMDYARFNYVAQPEDNVSEIGIFPRIGDYDKWAIKWGYSYSGAKTDEEDKKIVNKWTIDALNKNPRLWFGGEGMDLDPRSQTEDLGDDNMIANTYGIKNLQRVIANLPEWTKEEADDYSNLSAMYNQVIVQFNRYINHVVKNIGGLQNTYKTVEQDGAVYTATPKEKQKRAVAFLNTQLFETPEWLLDKNIMTKVFDPAGSNRVYSIQTNVLSSILSSRRLGLLQAATNTFGDTTYSVSEYMGDLHDGIWKELKTNSAVSAPRKNLQKVYVDNLMEIIDPKPSTPSTQMIGNMIISSSMSAPTNAEVNAIARAELRNLQTQLTSSVSATSDQVTKYHYQDLLDRINTFFDKSK
ncbi:MAG: zinc-dependent metalloprotease [Pseudopedobacter saltans]|uniref:Zinc-dependent metalloprotease n=1 Tax=Pseudopedobacter saltans TaxID=151895 RepID=A0A2W5F5Y7_9SPHI|nr:MAG: zinc-dependent metalloprotease [Pseudopedobacter saltans]